MSNRTGFKTSCKCPSTSVIEFVGNILQLLVSRCSETRRDKQEVKAQCEHMEINSGLNIKLLYAVFFILFQKNVFIITYCMCDCVSDRETDIWACDVENRVKTWCETESSVCTCEVICLMMSCTYKEYTNHGT